MRNARDIQSRARRDQYAGLTFVYLIQNGDVAKVGLGTIARLDTWQSRGWNLVAQVAYNDRPSAQKAEALLLTRIRGWGYEPVMPPGFDGWTETFHAAVIPWVSADMRALTEPVAASGRASRSDVGLSKAARQLWLLFGLTVLVSISIAVASQAVPRAEPHIALGVLAVGILIWVAGVVKILMFTTFKERALEERRPLDARRYNIMAIVLTLGFVVVFAILAALAA